MVNKAIIKILVDNDLKVTPQRVAILDVLLTLTNHPSVESISEYLRLNFPHISVGTVYKTLKIFTSKGIITKINPDINSVRLDWVKEKHHHLCSSDSDRMEDFYDDDLDKVLADYFSKVKIQNFTIEDFKLQITGKFTDPQN